jgi:hypothetical protein
MQRRARGLLLTALAAVTLAGSAWPATAATAPPGWQAENLPGIPLLSTLNAGAAVSAHDAWAVGGNFNTNSPTGAPDALIMHWNGTAWAVAGTTGIASGVQLESVVTPSGSAVWVSGDTSSSTVIYQLKGTKWARVPLPAGMPGAGITSGPDGQVWATAGSEGNALARWTGTAWHVYNTGLSASTTGLLSLSFASRTSGWAVGSTRASDTSHQPLLPLVLHWNGTSWRKAAAPPLPAGATTGGLAAVTATRSGVWATGNYEISGTDHDWLVHFNGTSWATVAVPAGFAPDSNSIGNISVGKSGQPQWASGDASGQTPGYLYYSDGKWAWVPGVATNGEAGFDPQVVSVPGSNATWAIGYTLWASGVQGVTGQIEYSP